jgi:hypothetical protein
MNKLKLTFYLYSEKLPPEDKNLLIQLKESSLQKYYVTRFIMDKEYGPVFNADENYIHPNIVLSWAELPE